MKTAVIEKDVIGGRCLNYACIPAKAVLRVADVLSEVATPTSSASRSREPAVDFGAVMERREKVIKTLTGGVAGCSRRTRSTTSRATARSPARATCGSASNDGDEIEGQGIVLATGSVPKPIPGTKFGGRVIGTEEAWALEELPETIAVVGAGASGAEIASAYARLGSRSCSSRRSTACCRPRTPTSPRSPSAASRSRASRSTPAPWSRTSRPSDTAARSPTAARPARPTGW